MPDSLCECLEAASLTVQHGVPIAPQPQARQVDMPSQLAEPRNVLDQVTRMILMVVERPRLRQDTRRPQCPDQPPRSLQWVNQVFKDVKTHNEVIPPLDGREGSVGRHKATS